MNEADKEHLKQWLAEQDEIDTYSEDYEDALRDYYGSIVTKILVADDSVIIQTSLGSIKVELMADCCSETWVSDAHGMQPVIGRKLQRISSLELKEGYNVEDGRGRQDEDEVYGFRITTDGGSCVVAYRNSSNGYYGGWHEITTAPLMNTENYVDVSNLEFWLCE